MAAGMDGGPDGQEPKSLPEAMAALTHLGRRVRDVENHLVVMSKGNCDALDAQKTSIDALMCYLQTHGVTTEQLLRDLTLARARLDQSRNQLSEFIERVTGERRLAALTHLRMQAEATVLQLRSQEQHCKRLIQKPAEVQELLLPVVCHTWISLILRLLIGVGAASRSQGARLGR